MEFFYFRDCFEELNPDYIFNSLSVVIKIQHDSDLDINNVKSDCYSFAILDLMAKAKLKSMRDEFGFRLVIDLMNEIIPGNSNGIYYDLIYDIYKWKLVAKKRIDDILKYKYKKEQCHDGMIHSEGLHIDAALSFYLYEIGLITQAKKLLLSIEKSGFASGMIGLYLKNINQVNCEEDNGC